MQNWSEKQYIFWITISYLLLSSFIIKKSVFTLPNLIILGGILAFLTSQDKYDQIQKIIPILSLIFPISVLNNVIYCKSYIFRRSFIPALILGSLGYLIQIFILAIILTVFSSIHEFFKNCLISILVLSTDAFSIQLIIHKIPEKLIFENLIQGQSIIIIGFGLSYFRICNQINSNTEIHSTLFIIDIIRQIFVALILSFVAYYAFNKLKLHLLETKVMFEIVLIMSTYFIAYFYLDVNEILCITALAILTKMRYKSGYHEIQSQKHIHLINNTFVILISLIIGYMDYQNETVTLFTFLEILSVYILQVIVRGGVIILIMPIFRYYGYDIIRQQLLLTIFGSMKGVNNIILLFFALMQIKQEDLKPILIKYCVHIILINNIVSNLILFRLKKFREVEGCNFLNNKQSLVKIEQFIQNQINQYDKNSIFINPNVLVQQTGLNQLRQYQKRIHSENNRQLKEDQNQLNEFLLFEQLYIEVRRKVVKQLKKKIEKYNNVFPKQYKILRQFYQRQQQHPDREILVFRDLKNTFLSLKFMKYFYKMKRCHFFLYQIYKTLSQEIQFVFNLGEIYLEVLNDLIFMLRLSNKFSKQYKLKIIEQLKDESQSINKYFRTIYSQLPNMIQEISNIKISRRIILKVKSHINNIYQYGELTQYSKQQFKNLFHTHQIRLNNITPVLERLNVIQMLKRHKIFSCLNEQDLIQIIKNSHEILVAKSKDILQKKFNISSKEIYLILYGSFSQKLNQDVTIWKTRGEFLRFPYIVYPEDRDLQKSIISECDSKILAIQINNIRKILEHNRELLKRVYSKSVYYFSQKYLDKGGQLSYFPQRYFKKLIKNSQLKLYKANEKIKLENGAYILSGEILSEQNKMNYLKGVNRYDQFCYTPPSLQNLIIIRQSLVLEFKTKIDLQIF